MNPSNEPTLGERARWERDAHGFPLQSSRPRQTQLVQLQQAFSLALEASASSSGLAPDWVTGAVALRLVLVSGRDLEDIYALRLAPKAARANPDWPTPILVELEGHVPALWLKAGVSPHKGGSQGFSNHAGKQSDGVWFSLDQLSVALLRRICSPTRHDILNDVAKWPQLFSYREISGLQAAVDAFRENAAAQLGFDPTRSLPDVGTCKLFLQRQLATSMPADPAISWLVTDTEPKRNATKSYYSSLSLSDADRYQCAAVNTLPPSPPAQMATDSLRLTPPPVLGERVVGSRYRATDEAVKKLRDHLLKATEKGRGTMTLERQVAFDQAFTTYCWLFFSMHTGWRSPNELLPRAPDIDWQTGAFLIEDKRRVSGGQTADIDDDDDLEANPATADSLQTAACPATDQANVVLAASRRRWLPLGERVCEQVQAYHQHLAGRKRLQTRSRRPLPISSLEDRKQLRTYLRALPNLGWDLPMNFSRHYLRSGLIGRLGGDAIAAYLGHWEAGSEPWWNGSCLDPLAYTAQTQRAISELLPKEEWPVIQGFPVPRGI